MRGRALIRILRKEGAGTVQGKAWEVEARGQEWKPGMRLK